MRERGAWVSAVGSACGQPGLLAKQSQPVARLHAPREPPFFPTWTLEEFLWAHRRALSAVPGALAPCPCIGSACQDRSEDPGPLRFLNPEAMPAKFVSPHQPGDHLSLPVTGFLEGAHRSPTPRRPRRPPPVHPEASVDFETSLRTGEAIIEAGGVGVDTFFPARFRALESLADFVKPGASPVG